MPIRGEELERALRALGIQGGKDEKEFGELNKKVDDLNDLIKSLLEKGVKMPTESDQSSSSQPLPQQPSSTSPSDSENSEEKRWETFFSKNGIAESDQQTTWKNTSGLTPEEAQVVWNNGWKDLTEKGGITDLVNKHATYTSKESKKETTNNVDLLKYKRGSLDTVHRFIFDMRNKNEFPLVSDKDIQEVLKNIEVPESRNYTALKAIREDRVKELFKKNFETNGQDHGLSEDAVDNWRIKAAETGLGGEGNKERKVFDNGWSDYLDDIKNKQLPAYSYNGKETKNIDVLKVHREELDKVHDILVEIGTKKTFFELPVNYEGGEHKIADLKYNQLPDDVGQVIAKAIEDQRNTFTYKVDIENNENKGDGLTPQDLTDALKEITDNKKEPQQYKPITANFLNEFLNASDLKISEVDEKGNPKLDTKKKNLPITKPVKVKGNEVEDLDEPNEALYGKGKNGEPQSWLQSQGAFILPKELTDREEALDLKIKGSESLPYFYEKNNYDPENPTFCKFTEEDGKKDIPIYPKGHKEAGAPVDKSGLLAIGTGIGKTTKTMNCLVNGGERNVILVCPNGPLCKSAVDHHSGWLQSWGCVIHKKPLMRNGQPVMEEVEDPITKETKQAPRYESHGSYPVADLNDLVYYKDLKGNTYGNKGLSVLEPWALLVFLTRELWATEKIKDKQTGEEKTGKELVEDRIKTMKDDKWIISEKQRTKNGKTVTIKVRELEDKTGKQSYTKWVAEAVSKLIPKDTIVVFDEAHFARADYQILTKYVIFLTKKMGFEVMKMSATFKGIPFSSTSTFPRKNLYMSSIASRFELNGEEVDFDALLAKSKIWLFLPDAEKGLNDKQKELLKKYDIAHVVFNQPFEKFCESISFGMHPSSLMIVDGSKEMGFTPDVDIVILSNINETSNLKIDWQYSTPNFSWISLASFAQQIGRAARIKEGWAITTSKELEEFVIKPEISVHVIKAALDGDKDALAKMKTAGFDDIHHLRSSIALANKENGKWGLYPAELVVGASRGSGGFPKWGDAKSSFRVDEVLMEKHDGVWEAPKLDAKTAKDIMDLMVGNYIKQRKSAEGQKEDKDYKGPNNFPYELNVEMKSSLIKEYGLDPGDVKKVLNGVIEERRKEIEKERKQRGNLNPDPVVFKANEEDLFHETVALLRLALKIKPGQGITVGKEKDEDGKEFWVMRVKYTPEKIGKKKIVSEVDIKREEKLQPIKAILYEHNLQLYKSDVGKEVWEALEKNTFEGYQNIITKLRSPRLANDLIAHIGNSNAMNLIFRLQKALQDAIEKDWKEKELELMQSLEASIEVKR